MLTLIHYTLCPLSRSIRLALSECGLTAELAEEEPRTWRKEFLELNPAGTLPVLIADNEQPICGVYAVSEYLAELAAEPGGDSRRFALFPGDAFQRAEARRLVDWFHRKFEAEVTTYIFEEKLHWRSRPQSDGPDLEALRAAQKNLRHHLSYIGHLMDERRWLAGDELSFADLAAAAQLSSMDYLGDVPWQVNEAARIWYARVKSRPSFRQLLNDRLAGVTPAVHYAVLDF